MKPILIIPILSILNSCILLVPFVKQDRDYSGVKSNNRSSNSCMLVKQTRADQVQIALKNLNHSKDAIRASAATELGMIAYERPGAIKALKEATWKDPSKWVRRAAIKAIYKLEGKKSYPVLRNALKDKDKWVVHSAKNLLNQ